MCKVSVICLTYNHAPYIAQALDSFVRQETSFRYEVIIHDDASTEGTADILREYAARYPDIIRPVFETENQYSQGIVISRDILMPLARGEFIAFCEGDDFWTDSRKLKKQVRALESHPEADICTHAAAVVKNGRFWKYYAPSIRNRTIPVEDVIFGGGNFVATNSILCRASVWKAPAPFRDVLFNDYSLQIQGSLRGGMVYLCDCMSVYRPYLPGSWSSRHISKEDRIRFHQTDKAMLTALDRYTCGRYSEVIRRRCALYDAEDKRTKRMVRLARSVKKRLIELYYRLRGSKFTS